jgi:hypothetical protein
MLSAPVSSMLTGKELGKQGKELVSNLAQFQVLHSDVRLCLASRGSKPEASDVPIKALREALIQAGVSENRLEIAEPKVPAPADPGAAEASLSIRFSRKLN